MKDVAPDVQSFPHSDNFCGGAFQDWLEVNLLPECNAKCPWCIEHDGYHPATRVAWNVIAKEAIDTGKKNIILLGGEPTIYPDLSKLIQLLYEHDRNVWITTNGYRLNAKFVYENLKGITGVNISLHHYKLARNRKITGLLLNQQRLEESIDALHELGAAVRLNCNIIAKYIDSEYEILKYIDYAARLEADSVRFAELKQDDSFVPLDQIMDFKYGLNGDPFKCGCHKEAIIDGMKVNFRQMCGLQTEYRSTPINPVQFSKEVLYYDGQIYRGWQNSSNLDGTAIQSILKELSEGKITLASAKKICENV